MYRLEWTMISRFVVTQFLGHQWNFYQPITLLVFLYGRKITVLFNTIRIYYCCFVITLPLLWEKNLSQTYGFQIWFPRWCCKSLILLYLVRASLTLLDRSFGETRKGRGQGCWLLRSNICSLLIFKFELLPFAKLMISSFNFTLKLIPF